MHSHAHDVRAAGKSSTLICCFVFDNVPADWPTSATGEIRKSTSHQVPVRLARDPKATHESAVPYPMGEYLRNAFFVTHSASQRSVLEAERSVHRETRGAHERLSLAPRGAPSVGHGKGNLATHSGYLSSSSSSTLSPYNKLFHSKNRQKLCQKLLKVVTLCKVAFLHFKAWQSLVYTNRRPEKQNFAAAVGLSRLRADSLLHAIMCQYIRHSQVPQTAISA